ncbi:MAG: response regulator [Acidiferrobacterales bacterium]
MSGKQVQEASPMNILLVDDHPLFRSGIAAALAELAESARSVEADSCEQALHLINGGAEFELILLDLNLPGMDGLTGLTKLRDATPATPIVILSATDHAAKIRQALHAGAKGYIPKSSGREIILSALRLVLSGGVYLPLTLMQISPPTVYPVDNADGAELTARQQEVLQLMARGKSNKEIAHALGMAENTVRVHVAAILKYLDVQNRTEAGFAAFNRGLV